MSTDASRPATDYFAPLRDEQFVVLTSYRASGAGVPTTVWFAEADGVIYITTQRGAGKARRIRANPRVLLTASDRVGNTHGDAIEARAGLLAPDEYPLAIVALRQKYREQYDRLTAQMDASRPENDRVFLAIAPP